MRLIKYVLCLRIVHPSIRNRHCPRPGLSLLSSHWSHGKLLVKAHPLSHTCNDSHSGLVARDAEPSSAIVSCLDFQSALSSSPDTLSRHVAVSQPRTVLGPESEATRSNHAAFSYHLYQSTSQALHFSTIPNREESKITHFSHLSRQQGLLSDKITNPAPEDQPTETISHHSSKVRM